MSRDQMEDVFPIEFNFKQGEQPTAAKLNGLVKFTDSAFSRVTQAVGDPWDAANPPHTSALSLEKLSQASIARILGPSDYASPLGGCWNEQMTTTVEVTLEENKNSWTLGYPLVEVSTPVTEKSTSVSSFVTKLSWGSDIVVTTDPDGVLSDIKSSIDEVVSDGDFYVDFYTGTITAYSSSSSSIILTISNLHMLGAGVPWGTHNVIPNWEETTLCNLAEISSTATTTTYTLTLPTVSRSPRYDSSPIKMGKKPEEVDDYDSSWSANVPNVSSNYRLPKALIDGYTSDSEIPEGYILLYYEDNERIIPSSLITFYYLNENSLNIVTSKDYLTEGSSYRLFTSGTSLAEAVSHLLQVQRNNNHVGLTANPTISYTVPLSHGSMDNLYTGDLDASATDVHRFKFTKSNYETNCHPQYLHRYGWMENDKPSDDSEKGNSGNAMRGNIVFSGNNDDMYVGVWNKSGNWTSTYGIMWGGGDQNSGYGNTELSFQGGEDVATWVPGDPPQRFPFVSSHTGGSDSDRYGALTYRPWYGTPLYLRGRNPSAVVDGAMLGFDLARQGELNYIKLFPGYRSTYDPVHQCANTGQTATTALYITPGLSGASFERLAAEQVREFRFRGIPYLSSATNTDNSIGDGLGSSEFEHSFVSPGMVGADFFNVYSNAIFFSDDGDGSRTSFTEHGKNWLDTGTGTYVPSGIYYIPNNGGTAARFSFVTQEDSTTASGDDMFQVGSAHGLRYYGERLDLITRDTTTFAGNSVNIDSSIATLRSPLFSTWFGYESILMDATEDKNLGILSYDGRVDIWACNSYSYTTNPGKGRHINIKTASTHGDQYSALQDCGNITLHAGYVFGATAPSSTGSKLYLKAYNDVNIESESQDVNITSTLGDINIDAHDNAYINSTDFTKLTTDGSSGKIEISTDSSNATSESGDISIEASGNQGRIYLSSADYHNIDVSSNYALTMRAYQYIALGTNMSENHVTNASNFDDNTITLSSRINKTNTGATGKILLDSINDVHLYALDDVLIDATDRFYVTAGGDCTFEVTGNIDLDADGKYYMNEPTAGAGTGGLRLDTNTREIKYQVSSLRYKENIKDIPDTSWIYDVRPVAFNYIKEDRTCYGLIAEETIKFNTDVVCVDKHNRPESVMYESVFSALIKAVQDQKKEIDALKAQLIGK